MISDPFGNHVADEEQYQALLKFMMGDYYDPSYIKETKMEEYEPVYFEGPQTVTIDLDFGETLIGTIEGEDEMTATEKLLFAANRLRDLVETRAVDGPDDEIMDDIADAYDELLLADEEENEELNEEEEELNS